MRRTRNGCRAYRQRLPVVIPSLSLPLLHARYTQTIGYAGDVVSKRTYLHTRWAYDMRDYLLPALVRVSAHVLQP